MSYIQTNSAVTPMLTTDHREVKPPLKNKAVGAHRKEGDGGDDDDDNNNGDLYTILK